MNGVYILRRWDSNWLLHAVKCLYGLTLESDFNVKGRKIKHISWNTSILTRKFIDKFSAAAPQLSKTF